MVSILFVTSPTLCLSLPPLSSSSIWLSGSSDGVSLRVLLFVMKIRFQQINGEILEKKYNLKESIYRKKESLWLPVSFLKHGGGLTDLNVPLSVFVCVCVYMSVWPHTCVVSVICAGMYPNIICILVCAWRLAHVGGKWRKQIFCTKERNTL